MATESLADSFVSVLAELRSITPDNDDEMRHVARNLRQLGEQVIADALRTASRLAWEAKQVSIDHRKAVQELRATETKE